MLFDIFSSLKVNQRECGKQKSNGDTTFWKLSHLRGKIPNNSLKWNEKFFFFSYFVYFFLFYFSSFEIQYERLRISVRCFHNIDDIITLMSTGSYVNHDNCLKIFHGQFEYFPSIKFSLHYHFLIFRVWKLGCTRKVTCDR